MNVMSPQSGVAIALTAVVGFFLGLVAAGGRGAPAGQPLASRPAAEHVEPIRPPAQPAVDTPGPVLGTAVDFSVVAARLNAAVVNVDNASRGSGERGRTFPPRYRRDMADDPTTPREGSGSGFIIDPDGFILTNHHVVDGADRLTVTTSDGRAYQATVVGVDATIDVALLKVEAGSPLPAAPLGRSGSLRVGEWVCAIGNPLGYVHSVTVGVVSFLGRKVFDHDLDALIQTDAAITFGNSGGPLINGRGEVVGMTTAISAIASNIGFAIPIDQIVDMLPQLEAHGRVTRGYLGLGLTTLTPDLQRALAVQPSSGALVQDVTPGTPADRAGLRAYDVIVGVDGRPIATDADLVRYISGRQPGSVTELDLWRDGTRRTVPAKLTERPVTSTAASRTTSRPARPVAAAEFGPLGIAVKTLDAATATRMRIPEAIQGVYVTRVDPAGPARLARITEAQVVIEINRQPIYSAEDFYAAVAGLRPGAVVALLIYDRLADARLIASVTLDPGR